MNSEPQNILFICSDQHNRNMLGAHGHPNVRTPHLDRLAGEGVSFTNAYTNSPICVPARASLATGRYVHDIGAWDNAAPYTGERASWGHRLTEQGVDVTTIGKLHYRDSADDTGFPDQRLPLHVLGGIGDLLTLIRETGLPGANLSRKQVLAAGPGESEYTRYDRAIAAEAVRFLRDEAPAKEKPWALFVSFVTPHYPLIAPQEYYDLYNPEDIEIPHHYRLGERPSHPVVDEYRRLIGADDELDDSAVRNALAAYYGLCSFMDAQAGAVLTALRDAGLDKTTRIIYASDHGDSMGEHGLWFKSTMYEGSVAIPCMIAGLDLPKGVKINEPVSLVDVFPTLVEAAGVRLAPEDGDLPGRSLLPLARGEAWPKRIIFSEYHAAASITGFFMLREGDYKYIHYVDYPPQLFNLAEDPEESADLAGDPRFAELLGHFEQKLRELVVPEETDQLARKDQRRRLDLHGGREAVIAQGFKVPYTPAPQID
ncbi:sulfatase-like hydrolase/transferase [Paenibacillus tepidiphilus]|uniref:sulfatase-like hydrolase/transferase n=1 Tax=Paenibacillus tepidiphilus TaxID=2608683 RepID=UPI00123B97AA|nr:sulfatase-like hydrolase/transferase [Paenibacillus tepidiphilus]